MWMKIAGSLMVITAGTALGFAAAARYNERPRHIRQLIGCLASLKAYISYISMPLPQALISCTQGVNGPVCDFLCQTADILNHKAWLSPQEAINQVLASMRNELTFERPEIELLSALGANMGTTSRDEQQKYLDMVQEQFRKIEQEAIKLREQNTKMYRYLGVCGGLVIVIMLV